MTDLRGFERSLPMALLRAREAVMRQFRPVLAAHDITEQQWRVLRALNSSDRALSMSELSQQTLLLGPSLSRMVASLAERGLVERAAGHDDGRRAMVSPTATARTLIDAIGPASEARYAWIEHELGATAVDQLYRLLERVADLDERHPD